MTAETLALIVGGQAAVVVGKIVFDWLKERRNGKASLFDINVSNKINQLYEWHSKTDEDGAPIWYFPRSFERKLDRMINHLAAIEKGLNGK